MLLVNESVSGGGVGWRARLLTRHADPNHITITSIKYLISYPINMKVSNQVFTTSNSNKCVGGLCSC